MQHLGTRLFSPFCAILSPVAPLTSCSPPTLLEYSALRESGDGVESGWDASEWSHRLGVTYRSGACVRQRVLCTLIEFVLVTNIVGQRRLWRNAPCRLYRKTSMQVSDGASGGLRHLLPSPLRVRVCVYPGSVWEDLISQ